MPALSVSIDGKSIVTVCTDGYDLLSVRTGGTLIDGSLADLAVSGGSYPQDGESTYLTWINALPLQVGQIVTISFLKSAASSHSGKTIAEMFPDEEPATGIAFKSKAEMFNELRAKPKLRERLSFRIQSSLGTDFMGHTNSDEHGFGFTVNWNSSYPARARVSLHSYTLESLEISGSLNNHVDEHISFGDSVHFELVV